MLTKASLPLSFHQDLRGSSGKANLGLGGTGTAVYIFPSLITMICGSLGCRFQVWTVGCALWTCGRWIAHFGPLVCGSDRLEVPGSVVCGLWAVGCGLWSVGGGLWSLGCVLWTMDCGLWKLGLWV